MLAWFDGAHHERVLSLWLLVLKSLTPLKPLEKGRDERSYCAGSPSARDDGVKTALSMGMATAGLCHCAHAVGCRL